MVVGRGGKRVRRGQGERGRKREGGFLGFGDFGSNYE